MQWKQDEVSYVAICYIHNLYIATYGDIVFVNI